MTQKQAEKKESIVEKKIAQKEAQNGKAENKLVKVAGEQTKNIQTRTIALTVLIGIFLLILTWTVKRKKKKV